MKSSCTFSGGSGVGVLLVFGSPIGGEISVSSKEESTIQRLSICSDLLDLLT